MVQAYCVKDRQMVEMSEAKQITLKNGRPAMQGKCPKCGTTVTRIGGGQQGGGQGGGGGSSS